MFDARIIKELTAHGASTEQARSYVELARRFEKESDSKGELHHILPRNSGWWKRFENAKWNYARVEWHLHIALHAYLAHIFPENNKLLDALRATTMRRHKNDRYKTRITRWYKVGKTSAWIAKRVGVRASTIIKRLHRWDVPVRPAHRPVVATKLQKQKDKVIRWYANRRSTVWIAKRIGSSENTVARYLKIWGVKVRSCCSFRFIDRLNEHKEKIITWYAKRKTASWIGRKLGVSQTVVYKYLKACGIKRHGRGESRLLLKMEKKRQFITDSYKAGRSGEWIGKKLGSTGSTVIIRWLKSWGVKPAIVEKRLETDIEN